MHDLHGMSNHVMTNVLLELIKLEFFTIIDLNRILKNINFEYETKNIVCLVFKVYIRLNLILNV